MDETAEKLLKYFAEATNRSLLHPTDWKRFFEFAIYVHEHGLSIKDHDVSAHLRNHSFPPELSVRLGSEYANYLDLLNLYDSRKR